MKNKILIMLTMLVCWSLFQAAAQDTVLTRKYKRGKWGYVNSKGKTVIDFRYWTADDFDIEVEGLAKVQTLDRKWGYFDKTGREVIPCKYDKIDKFSDELATVRLDDKWGCIDKTGREVIPCMYDWIDISSDGLLRVRLNDKWGYFDKTGREVIPCKYDRNNHFSSDGLAKVQLNGKWGYIDKTGNEVISCKYDLIVDFSLDGLAKVQIDNKWGYIDKIGKEVIPPKYDFIGAEWSYNKSNAVVWKDGKTGWINKTGNETVPLKYKSQQMQAIWENLLAANFGKINAYRLGRDFRSNSTSSGSFTIERPYLLVSAYKFDEYDIDFVKSSENNFNEQAVNGVKTLIVCYDYSSHSRQYNDGSTVKSYGSYLVYFDVIKKEIIGFDKIQGPDLPQNLSANTDGLRNNPVQIINKIESRLATQCKQTTK